MGILVRRKVLERNVETLPKRMVLTGRNSADALVSLIAFSIQSLKTLTFIWCVLSTSADCTRFVFLSAPRSIPI